jgi:hypothetical protein
MLEVRPMPRHEVIEEALLIHGAPGRFKQLQGDRRFFFEVFYKTKARVHAGTTEQSSLGSRLDTIETTEIPGAIRPFLSATAKIRAELTALQPCFGGQSRSFTTSDTSHTHPCNREPDEETLPARFRR